MKSTVLVPLCLLSTVAAAGQLSKPYFAATTPGAWSLYELTASGVDPYRYTYTRLPDEDRRARAELRVDFTGQFAATSSRSVYTFERGFVIDTMWLDYNRHVERMAGGSTQSPDLTPMDASTIAAIRESVSNFDDALTFVGAETIDGRACDHYSYEAPSGGPAPTIEAGDLWLDPTVPFGIVLQKAEIKERSGAVRSTYQMRLLETGASDGPELDPAAPVVTAVAAATGAATIGGGPAAIADLAEAFDTGAIGLRVRVVEGSGGRRLTLEVSNATDARIDVSIPEGPSSLPAGPLLGTLTVVTSRSVALHLAPGETSTPVEVEQDGDRGAASGSCELSRSGDTTSMTGHVTVGSLP